MPARPMILSTDRYSPFVIVKSLENATDQVWSFAPLNSKVYGKVVMDKVRYAEGTSMSFPTRTMLSIEWNDSTAYLR